MIRISWILFLLFIFLDARQNPFFPSSGEEDTPYTSNEDRSKSPLKRATINIPSQARLIQKVTIEFKNLDGSIESQSIELDNTVDWHLPIFISQSYTKVKDIKDKELKKKEFIKLSSMKFASFYSHKKSLKILTDDKLIRNFLLTKPHRIVVDFEKDASLKYMNKTNANNVFSKIRVANHDGYYRVVIELDGYYRYKMKKISNGYLFKLR
ncbi:MAG: AMIN domain-containing protein [Sulfurimonas sp.]|nr:MAG: AMIN domain-containing protein [Sulfurimonas sp.]